MELENKNNQGKNVQCYAREMPTDRFIRCGGETLTNEELIAVLLRTGSANENVMELARRVLQIRNNPGNELSILYDVTLEDLCSIRGIGKTKAVRLLAVLELSKRLVQEPIFRRRKTLNCSSPEVVAHFYMEKLRHKTQEEVVVLMLNSRLELIKEETLNIGTVNASYCSPRDVFMCALHAGAVAILVMHNHPSGDPAPSMPDIDLTRQLAQAGQMLEIPLVDHLIIGDQCYTSMKKEGYLA